MDERNPDAQHRAVETWMQTLNADRTAGTPLANGALRVHFFRGPQFIGMLYLDADGRLGRER